MKKYALCVKTPMTYCAGSKAVIDATDIAISVGYKKMYYACVIPTLSKTKWSRYLIKFINLILCVLSSLRISKSNSYFLQWPFPGKNSKILFRALIRKHARFTILIHDLNDLRGMIYPEDMKIMYSLFNTAESIIVHTDSMKEYLVSKGVDVEKLHVLYTFDYLTDDVVANRTYSKIVAFAGNLSKSTFLENINKTGKDFKLYCYGANCNDNYSGIVYKGKFSPNNVSQIEGSWGLVWDGTSTETCKGEFGDYLKYNSPHKVSLYIVAELPIIIWKDQALAKYVTKRNLGITISSIDEIPVKLSKISESMYLEMKKNVKAEARILRNGGHLREFL